MSKVRSKRNKSTELRLIILLRKAAIRGWRRGSKLPGSPDFVFSSERVVIFVDGDFWHGNPKTFVSPKSNTEFWTNKIQRNRRRDRRTNDLLRKRGWIVLRIWESSLRKRPDVTVARIGRALGRLTGGTVGFCRVKIASESPRRGSARRKLSK